MSAVQIPEEFTVRVLRHIGTYCACTHVFCHFWCFNIRSDIERNFWCLMFWRQDWCWLGCCFCFSHFLSF